MRERGGGREMNSIDSERVERERERESALTDVRTESAQNRAVLC